MTTADLQLTESASKKVSEILQKTPDKPHFRVQIKGGGCNGFEYVFGIDDSIGSQDFSQHIKNCAHPFVLLVDAISLQYLQSAKIDYVLDARGERFVVNNPVAQTSCSCGSSFAVSGEPPCH